jgi:prephenate dehydrogenase
MRSLGIIGYGSFGAFMVDSLQGYFDISVYSSSGNAPSEISESLEAVCNKDYLIIGFPLGAYVSMLPKIRQYLGQNTLIIDVCSVKQQPIALLGKYCPDVRYIATHPLFGPQSAADGLKDHTMVVCESNAPAGHVQEFKDFCSDVLQLKVVAMSSQQHDKEMARVHALTFFVARALHQHGVQPSVFQTPSFQKILSLAELDASHSDELFDTIIHGNQYAQSEIRALMQTMDKLSKTL